MPQPLLDSATLVARFEVSPGLYDEVRLAAALRQELRQPELTPVERGVWIAQALALLPEATRSQLALHLVYGCERGQLQTIGRGGLVSLRAACSLADGERTDSALASLDAALSKAPPQVREVAGVVVVSEGLGFRQIRSMTRRLGSMDITSLLGGLVLIVRPRGEEATDAGVLLEHLRLELDAAPLATLEKAIAEGSVLCVEAARLLAPQEVSVLAPARAAIAQLGAWFDAHAFGGFGLTPVPVSAQRR